MHISASFVVVNITFQDERWEREDEDKEILALKGSDDDFLAALLHLLLSTPSPGTEGSS